jgi:hypothetical protein
MIKPVYLWNGDGHGFEWRKREQYDHDAYIFSGVLTLKRMAPGVVRNESARRRGIKFFDGHRLEISSLRRTTLTQKIGFTPP